MNQKLASRLPEKHGHDVITAGIEREALERLENESFDLVLIDVQMPEIGGFAVTAKIQKMEEATGTHLPVIAMTTHPILRLQGALLGNGQTGFEEIDPALSPRVYR